MVALVTLANATRHERFQVRLLRATKILIFAIDLAERTPGNSEGSLLPADPLNSAQYIDHGMHRASLLHTRESVGVATHNLRFNSIQFNSGDWSDTAVTGNYRFWDLATCTRTAENEFIHDALDLSTIVGTAGESAETDAADANDFTCGRGSMNRSSSLRSITFGDLLALQ